MKLAGEGIVVTRPREQAQGLAALIEQAGGRPLLFPAIEIADAVDPEPLRRLLGQLDGFDLAVFVSPTAVRKAMQHVPAWPPGLTAAAIGGGTRRQLEQCGIRDVLAPVSGADSEALLALPELANPAGRRVVIFRGAGGRALLGDTLRARGARVEYAECYRRLRPAAESEPLLREWNAGRVHAVAVSSAEGLSNLFGMLGEPAAERLRSTPLFVGHERVADDARRLGARMVFVAGPGDAALVERLVAYFRPAK